LDEREYADDGDDDRTCKLFGNRILNKLVDEAGFFIVCGCPTRLGYRCLLVLVLSNLLLHSDAVTLATCMYRPLVVDDAFFVMDSWTAYIPLQFRLCSQGRS